MLSKRLVLVASCIWTSLIGSVALYSTRTACLPGVAIADEALQAITAADGRVCVTGSNCTAGAANTCSSCAVGGVYNCCNLSVCATCQGSPNVTCNDCGETPCGTCSQATANCCAPAQCKWTQNNQPQGGTCNCNGAGTMVNSLITCA